MNNNWRNFVLQTLNDLRTGAEPPDYFGCIRDLIIDAQNTNSLPDFPQANFQPNVSDEDNYQNYHTENLNKQHKTKTVIPQSPPEISSSEQSPNVIHPKETNQLYNYTVDHSSLNSLSESQQENHVSQSLSSPPKFQRKGKTQFNEFHESEPIQEFEFQQQNPEEEEEEYHESESHTTYSQLGQKETYESRFRAIGDSIIGTYWYPVDTIIPRLTLDSKLMCSFKTSKFKSLMNAMNEHFGSLEPHHLKFIRTDDLNIE